MKLILNLFQQVLLLIILIGGGFFAYFNQTSVSLNIPYTSSVELPLWLICFICVFIGFLACYFILKTAMLANIKIPSLKKQEESQKY